MYSFNKSVFKEYDIRGIVERDFSQRFISDLAKAFAVYISNELDNKTKIKVAIGRDARLSGATLLEWFSQGLISSGVEVVDLGVCPTPCVYYSMFNLDVDGAVMITGSHNPPEYNGFKLGFAKTTIYSQQIQKLREILESQSFIAGKGDLQSYDIISDYIDYQLNRHANISRLPNKPKVVIDAGNGTAGIVAPEILKKLGCEVVELFCEPDGTFPNHHPDPTVEENLQLLKKAVIEHGADVGFSFDGDSDRIGVIDEQGGILWGDEIMIVLARDVLKRHPGATIVGEVKCSRRMYQEIAAAGGKAVMWKAGHSLIKNKMKELKAVLAGEMSGHIFFSEDYFGFDDAIFAALEMTRILGESLDKKTMSDYLKGLKEVFVTPEIRIDCDEQIKFKLVEKVKELIVEHYENKSLPSIESVNTIDGIRAEFAQGWGLVRASNTQPILVSRFEAENMQKLQEYKSFVQSIIDRAKPLL